MPAGAFGRGLAVEDFRAEFVALCEQHQRDQRALVFGVILYSYKDAEVIKALEDRAYWNALDELSGRYATIFVFYSPLDQPQAPDDFWSRAAKEAQGALDELSHCFLRGEPFTLPAILFFQVENGTVIDGVAVTLRAERAEDSFLEMKKIIRTVTRSLQRVKEENQTNAGPIFGLVRNALADRALQHTVRRWATSLIDVVRLGRLFTGLSGN
jgi:hypothetical protein